MSDSANLLIVGCGLLGSSVARAFRRAHPQATIWGIEPHAHTLGRAAELGLFDAVFTRADDLPAAAAGELLIGVAATPPAMLADAVTRLAARCALVMDVGSVKAPVIDDLLLLGPMPEQFVPCHPMAGSHRSGPEAGIAELFDQRWVFVVPVAETAAASVAAAHEFWRSLGAQTQQITAQAHDSAVAYTSHLPHLLSSAYMAVETPEEAAAGTGFMEFTRLAKSNPQMWSQVLQANQLAWRPLLQSYIKALTEFDELIATGDTAAIMGYLEAQRAARTALDIPEVEAHSLV